MSSPRAEGPLDPDDPDGDERRPAPDGAAPWWPRPRLVGLVVLGGTIGTAARAGLEDVHPAGPGAWPWTTFLINVLGAFLLGVLLHTLARRGPDTGRRRELRVGLGTGVLGGFTTYSTFAVEVDRLLRDGSVAMGLAYGVGSVLVGLAAAGLGLHLGSRAGAGTGA